MKTTFRIFGLAFSAMLLLTACGDERPGKIEAIKSNDAISEQEKLEQIIDISSKCLTCGQRNFRVGENEEGVSFAIYEYLDEDFIHTSTEAMQRIVTGNIARTVWRTFHDTQGMDIEAIALDFYARIRFSDGFNNVLLYELAVAREDLELIDGFYTVDPYANQDVDVYDIGSEQDKIIDEVRAQLTYLTDNSNQVSF